ncbi:hypothetical protein WR25_17859 [Diploscapter pachys]|uniref:Uncharacterized protein n=1 Tax=Diploscapter pachys TaxID=2018661 RepID=A0A2A2M5U2_9BILA|nr:hypothetical protein WR25_17859 [Diploscapter pachys]
MIDVPVTAPSSLRTCTSTGWLEARVTNLALARACRPRLLVIRTVRSIPALMPPPRPAPRMRPRYICVPPRAPQRPPRPPSSTCAPIPAGSAWAGSSPQSPPHARASSARWRGWRAFRRTGRSAR